MVTVLLIKNNEHWRNYDRLRHALVLDRNKRCFWGLIGIIIP